MDRLFLNGTEESPEIVLDKDGSEFRVTGKSYMEDAASFFEPVLDWLKTYRSAPNNLTIFKFELEYVNTASSKIVHDILSILDQVYKLGNEVRVEWHYYEEDEDMLELGEEYEEVYDLPFKFEEINFGRPKNMFDVD